MLNCLQGNRTSELRNPGTSEPLTTIRTIDAHAGGAPFRLVVEGMPVPAGRTLQQKLRALRKEQDGVRRLLMREPRGHLDLAGAVLTEPVTPGADAGVIFMHASDFAPLCGHGLLVVATVAPERGLLHLGDRQDALVFDTAVGPFTVEVERAPGSGVDRPLRIVSAAFVGPPSFVWRAGVRVGFAGRQVPVDVAFGGEFS